MDLGQHTADGEGAREGDYEGASSCAPVAMDAIAPGEGAAGVGLLAGYEGARDTPAGCGECGGAQETTGLREGKPGGTRRVGCRGRGKAAWAVVLVAGVVVLVGAVVGVGVMFEVLVGGGSSSDDGVSPAFGHPMRSEFGFDEDWVNLNQGSFGAVPLKILDKLHSFEQLAEQRVEIWFNFIEGYHGYLLQSRAAIAIYVSANESDIVMVENGSGGMNSVLRSQIFSPGDRILVLDSAYPMVKKILDYLTEVEGIEVLVVPPFTYPLNSTTQIVDAVRSFIEANIASPIKFAIFSHVEAAPSTVLPVTELVAMAHSYGITVAVDGSQAMGNIDINITAIDPDYYVATAYKWFFAPKGTGFLYARNSLQTKSNPMPPIISEYVNAFPDRFSYTGTRDYCPFSTMVDVFTWRDYVGGDKAIKDYNINLAWAAAEFLSSTWGTVISGPPEVASAMADVKFPEDDWELANWVHDTLLSRYNKVMYIYQLPDGTIWTRISASIYLELSDFETLSYQVNNLIAEYRASSVH